MCDLKYLGNFISLKGERFLERHDTLSTEIIKAYLPVAQKYSFTDFVLLV